MSLSTLFELTGSAHPPATWTDADLLHQQELVALADFLPLW